MSKCYPNWQRLPNSQMDRQHRPKTFFRGKDRVIDNTVKGEEKAREITADEVWKRAEMMKEAMLYDN